ncbi:DUF883 family protein [Cerasicoccus frondis]|uniref:DUF883 family protein n=1 Tax=Cerasicoccus frondis TaxID=490090 RepID=UPI002852C3A3|nr:hypothetical protein [Cerasicoccus frondis]
MPSKATTADKLAEDRDKLVADLKLLMEDAKHLTADASDGASEFATEKAELVREQLSEIMAKLKTEGEHVKAKAKDTTKDLEKLIKDNPWQSLGVAVLAGIVIDRFMRD